MAREGEARTKNPITERLTPRQRELLEFLERFQLERGYSPSYEEIARGLGIRSKSVIHAHVARLKKRGLLAQSLKRGERGKRAGPRSLAVSPGALSVELGALVSLPVLGKVAAGRPIEAAASAGTIEIPASALARSGEHFVLRVQGDSMIEDQIRDGDWIVVRKQETAENGETVVALIDGEATLKRFYRHDGRIELHPANPAYAPIRVEPQQQLRIAGVLVYLHRKY